MVKHKQLICPECDNEFWNEYDHKIDQVTVKTYMCNGCEVEMWLFYYFQFTTITHVSFNFKPSEEKPKQTLEKCFNCGEEFYLEEETIRYRVTAETIFKNEPVVTEYTLYFCDSGCFHQYEHGAEKHEERKML